MKPYPEVLSRHTDKNKAFRAYMEAHFIDSDRPGFKRWRSNVALRKVGNYWLILLRSYATVHAGNKKWRASVRKRRNS